MVTKKDKLLAAAQKFLEKGSLDKALAEFQKAVQEDPKDTRTWLRIAELHVKRGDSEKATEVYLRTADLYVEQGFFQRAVAVYKNIIKLSPGFVDAHFKLAEIYKQLGLLSDAVQQFEQVASVHQKAGRMKEAIAAMRQVVDLNPDQPVARIKLAEAASQAGLVEDAVPEFARAAELLKAQGRTDEYLRVAERLLYHKPDDVALSKEVAQRYIERQNARFALAKLQVCFQADPRDPETLDLLGRAFEQLGQIPKTVSVLKELVRVHEQAGRTAERNQVVQRILTLDPRDAEAREMSSHRSYASLPPAPSLPSPALPPPRPSAPGPFAGAMPTAVPPVEPPQRGGSSGSTRITFSEMAVPDFAREVEPPPIETAAPESATERMAIASGMLERSEDEVSSEVQRIISEADVFVKYGLVERAADHLRKVFEYLPTHPGAHERLAAVLLRLGRKPEAVLELEVLAEQLASSSPEEAVRYARRALEIEPGSRRAGKVVEALGRRRAAAAQPDSASELEAALIEMDTPQPEPIAGAEEPGDDEEVAEVDSGGIEFFEVSEASGAEHQVPDPIEAEMTRALPSLRVARGAPAAAPREPAGEIAFDRVERTTGEDEETAALMADLEQVDFFIDQDLHDEARSLLDDLEMRYPRNPHLLERRARLARPTPLGSASSGPVVEIDPDPIFAEATVVSPQRLEESTAIRPRAVVASGGPADLATHRDLGIAYKEMGLFDAAIEKFVVLKQDPAQEVFALTMIGECHEAKGETPQAIACYKQAINRPAASPAESNQLLYQLGGVFQTLGDAAEALYYFEAVAKRDAGFRDVRRRIAELRGQPPGTEPRGAGGAQDTLEHALESLTGGGQNRSRR